MCGSAWGCTINTITKVKGGRVTAEGFILVPQKKVKEVTLPCTSLKINEAFLSEGLERLRDNIIIKSWTEEEASCAVGGRRD